MSRARAVHASRAPPLCSREPDVRRHEGALTGEVDYTELERFVKQGELPPYDAATNLFRQVNMLGQTRKRFRALQARHAEMWPSFGAGYGDVPAVRLASLVLPSSSRPPSPGASSTSSLADWNLGHEILPTDAGHGDDVLAPPRGSPATPATGRGWAATGRAPPPLHPHPQPQQAPPPQLKSAGSDGNSRHGSRLGSRPTAHRPRTAPARTAGHDAAGGHQRQPADETPSPLPKRRPRMAWREAPRHAAAGGVHIHVHGTAGGVPRTAASTSSQAPAASRVTPKGQLAARALRTSADTCRAVGADCEVGS